MASTNNVYDGTQSAKYINGNAEFRAGQVMNAVDINRWINMLINQGDYNTSWLEYIMEQLAASKVREDALTARVAALETSLASANDNIAILLALHGRQPV